MVSTTSNWFATNLKKGQSQAAQRDKETKYAFVKTSISPQLTITAFQVKFVFINHNEGKLCPQMVLDR